jgi:uncharacterized membrane protein
MESGHAADVATRAPREALNRSAKIGGVTEREWALLIHLVGVVLLFAGMTVAGVAEAGARRQERPDLIAALLGLTRTGVALVAAGAVIVVGGGLWLIEASNGAYSLGDGWIAASFGLLVLAFAFGGLGGQRPKRARLLAGRSTGEPGELHELRALLDDRLSRGLNYAAALAVVAALVLMVWKPGL